MCKKGGERCWNCTYFINVPSFLMSQRFSPGLLWKMSQLAVRHKKATSSPSLLHQCFCSRFHKYSKLKKINLFSTIFFSGVHTLASVCLKVLMIQVQQFTTWINHSFSSLFASMMRLLRMCGIFRTLMNSAFCDYICPLFVSLATDCLFIILTLLV